jgi:hypothetical protein
MSLLPVRRSAANTIGPRSPDVSRASTHMLRPVSDFDGYPPNVVSCVMVVCPSLASLVLGVRSHPRERTALCN